MEEQEKPKHNLIGGNAARRLAKLNTFQKYELIKKVIEWHLNGYKRADLIDAIHAHSPVPLIDKNCDDLIVDAKRVLEASMEVDGKKIIYNHLESYEFIYAYFAKIKNEPGGFESIAIQGMNKVLKAKERLVGLLKPPKVVVNKKTKVTITKKEIIYDKTRLTEAENKRLEELIEKIRVKKS